MDEFVYVWPSRCYSEGCYCFRDSLEHHINVLGWGDNYEALQADEFFLGTPLETGLEGLTKQGEDV